MKKFLEVLNKAEPAITMICIVGFTSVLMLGAAVRLTGHPLNWCNGVALLMLAWTTFLGGDVAFRAGKTVNMDILVGKLPVTLQKAVALIVYAVLLVMMFTIVRQGFQLCANMSKRALEGIPSLSYIQIAASIPVGFSLVFITTVECPYDLMKTTDSTIISKI